MGVVHHLVEAQVDRTPDAVAVVFGDRALTYRELDGQANQLATYLRRLGVALEHRVAVLLERSLELEVALLAILKAGAAYVPIDPTDPHDRIADFLADCAPTVVVTAERFRGAAGDARIVTVDDAPWSELPTTKPEVDVTPEHLCYVIYTSGSTGRPKGVMTEHGAVSNRLCWAREAFPLSSADRVIQKTPYTFDVSVGELFGTLVSGATLVMIPPEAHRDPAWLSSLIIDHEITSAHFVPSMLRHWLRDPGAARCRSLRRILCSGEALAQDLVSQCLALLDIELHNLYGPTEAAIEVAHWVCRADDPGPMVPLGHALPNVRLEVVDDQLAPVPAGQSGELIIAGIQVARGYWQREELTRERFVARWRYRTGDLARYRADGVLEYLGRADDQVKIRGIRVELGEIEAALRSHPGVRDCVCMLRSDAGEPALVAYCVLDDVSIPSLRAHLATRVPDYMVPAHVVVLPALPLTPSGKADRRALPSVTADRSSLAELVPPRTELEHALCAIWSEVLGRASIGIEDDFLALGGHSLLGARIAARIREELAVSVPLATLLRSRTIAVLAREVEAGPHAPRTSIPIATRDHAPLSLEQERLWFLDQVEDALTAYNISYAWRLRGELDIDALRRAFEALVERHHVLRTTIVLLGDEPRQVVRPNPRFELPVESGAVDEIWRAERERPFHLDRDPMLRARLIAIGEHEHVLIATMHHIASDGASASILWRELSALHAGAALVPRALQYADYAVWQRGRAIDPAALAYWKTTLDGAIPLDLPTDHQRPPRVSFHGAAVPIAIPAQLAAELHRLATREGVTLQILVVAALQVLLYRYTGQRDLSIAIPTTGRTHDDLTPLIGFFINVLVIRGEVTGTFRDVLARARARSLEAYDHEVPFASLVAALAPDRDASRFPLAQVFAQVIYPDPDLALTGLEVTPVPTPPRHVGYELQLDLVAGDELRGHLVYGTSLVTEQTAEQLRDHLLAVLHAIAMSPDTSIDALPLLSDAEQHRLVVEWNATTAPIPERSIHALFEDQARRTPDAIAVRDATEHLRFDELDARATALAHRLLARELGDQARVGLAVDRSVAMVVGMLGILKAGAAYVPLDPSYPPARLADLRRRAGATAIVADRRGLAVFPDAIDIAATDGEPRPLPAVHPTDLFAVIYTSGSTGEPKGVELAHRNIANRLAWMWREVPFAPGEVACQKTVLGFVDSIWEVFGPLLAGVPLVIASDDVVLDPARLVELLAAAGVTRIVLVPSLLRVLLEVVPDLAQALPRLRIWTSSGEVLSHELASAFVRALPDARLLNLYGSSEVTADVTCFEVTAATLRAPIPIGRPIANTQIYLLDPALRPVPPRVAAEIFVGGAAVARGYHATPSERFLPNPFGPGQLFRTGDFGRYRHDGNLEYLGRTDSQVKIRGFRIELAEIEARLRSHPAVAQVAVVVDRSADPRLVAYCVPTGTRLDSDALRTHLAAALPSYMVPADYVALPALRLLPNGKLDHRSLPRSERQAPIGTDVASTVRGHFEAILGRTGVGARDDFFRVGGHSLAAMRLVSRINSHHAAGLSIRTFLEAPTIDGVVAVLEQAPVIAPAAAPIAAFSRRLAEVAAEHPLRVAVLSPGSQLTYEELNYHSNHVAFRLVSLGWDPQMTVRIQRPLGRDALIAIVALLKLGATFELVETAAGGAMTLVRTARDNPSGSALALDEVIASSASWWVEGPFDGDHARWDSGRADACPPRHATAIAFHGVSYDRIDRLAERAVLDRPTRRPWTTPLAFLAHLAEGATTVLGAPLRSWLTSDSQALYEVVRQGDGPILVCVGDTITLLDLIRAAPPDAEILWFKLDGIQVWPPRKHSLATHADALARVLATRDPSRSVTLVGFSGGATLAHAIATRLAVARSSSPLAQLLDTLRGAGAWRRRQDLVDGVAPPVGIERWKRWGHRVKEVIHRHPWQPFTGPVAVVGGAYWNDYVGTPWFALWHGPIETLIRPTEDHFSFFMNPTLHAEWVALLRRTVRAAAGLQLVVVEPMALA